MRRPLLLLASVLVLGTVARLLSAPVYVGAPAEPRTPWWDAVGAPFGDDLRGSCNAFLSNLGESLRREGLRATGGIPVLNVEDAAPEHYWYYDHHTPGVPLVTALAFTLGGRSERTARLLALCFSTLTTALLMVLVRRAWGTAAAAVAGVAHAFLPLGLFWGTHLNFEVPTLPFLLLFLTAALRERPAWGQAVGWLALAFLMDVVALFGVFAVALEVLGRRRPRDLVPLLGAAGVLVLSWMVWRGAQEHRYGFTDASSLVAHLQSSTMLSPAFAAAAWGQGVLKSLLLLGGGWPLALLVFECWLLLLRGAATPLDRVFRASLVVAVLNVVLPAVQATSHEYYVLYFQLPLALAAARFAWRAARLVPGAPRAGAALAGALALALATHGVILDRLRPAPSTAFPSAHRLGQELAAAAAGREGEFLLPPYEAGGPSWQLYTVLYYAGRLVWEGDPADATLRTTVLAPLGLGAEPWLYATPRQWPGRDGLTEFVSAPPPGGPGR